jgi:hypothetical protein
MPMASERDGAGREFELTEANAAGRLITFIDAVAAPRVEVAVTPDGGEFSHLTTDAEGRLIQRRSPNGVGDEELHIGNEVFYKAPDSTLYVASFTDDYLIQDRREYGQADMFTLLGERVGSVLLEGANVDRVAARAVTINFGKKDHTTYVVISQKGKNPALFRDNFIRILSGYSELFQDIVGEQHHVTRLSPPETLQAVSSIRDAYISTTTSMRRAYHQAALQREQAFRG